MIIQKLISGLKSIYPAIQTHIQTLVYDFNILLLYIAAFIPVTTWLIVKNLLLLYSNTPLLELSRAFALLALGSIVAALLVIPKYSIKIPLLNITINQPIDRLYIHHQVLMALSLIFGFAHYITLLVHYKGTTNVAQLLLPFGDNIVSTWGILALLSMAVGVSLTYLTSKINYKLWIIFHSIFSVSFLIATIHVINVPNDISIYTPLKIVVYTYITLGILLWIYRVLLRLFWKKVYGSIAVVTDTVQLNDKDTLVKLKVTNQKLLNMLQPGHYIFVKFRNIDPSEHPFTIVNKSKNAVELIIRRYKGVTKNIQRFKGQRVFIKGPFGTLPEHSAKYPNIVCISAGVGITPCIGLINLYKYTNKTLNVFYVTRNKQQDTITPYLRQHQINNSNILNTVIWYTSEKSRPSESEIKQYLEAFDPTNTLLVITGPPAFIESMKNIAHKVNKRFRIYNENIQFNKPIWLFKYVSIAILLSLINIIAQALLNDIHNLRQ